ncbi:hypothetical protein C9374_004233 [Naegleria lovaniensis]|uniref:Guanosine-3',5'-bis(diphosphate) 3'-pyrophosphohydrolase MESH1 n=1 Tax=Naegleria lovaniensis TaxID=51637 RepID=A0AA88GS43_NAELO|nr:uncharacterized protein C9374_004233 [Naegleria lovaniensis]KAG2383562.1 hypothetical protein C9374_004233 [Naegleria lovaniensis]
MSSSSLHPILITPTDTNLLGKSIQFATLKHASQMRKDNKTPYVEHPKSVANRLNQFLAQFKDTSYVQSLLHQTVSLADSQQPNKHSSPTLCESILCAAVLHDTLEDTETTFEELETQFGPVTARLVSEVTNDDSRVKALCDKKLQEYHEHTLDESAKTILVDGLNSQIENLSEAVLRKRLGRGAYFVEKLNSMSLEALLVKLADRLDNILDVDPQPSSQNNDLTKLEQKPKHSHFNTEYKYETRYVMANIDRSRLTPIHEELVSNIVRAVY